MTQNKKVKIWVVFLHHINYAFAFEHWTTLIIPGERVTASDLQVTLVNIHICVQFLNGKFSAFKGKFHSLFYSRQYLFPNFLERKSEKST